MQSLADFFLLEREIHDVVKYYLHAILLFKECIQIYFSQYNKNKQEEVYFSSTPSWLSFLSQSEHHCIMHLEFSPCFSGFPTSGFSGLCFFPTDKTQKRNCRIAAPETHGPCGSATVHPTPKLCVMFLSFHLSSSVLG